MAFPPCDKCGIERILISPATEIIVNKTRYISCARFEYPQEIKCNRKGCKTILNRCQKCDNTCVPCDRYRRGQIEEVIKSFDNIYNQNGYNIPDDVRNIALLYLLI